MLQEIAALAAVCLTLTVVALGCEKQRRPPAGLKRSRNITEPNEPVISKLELPSSRTGGGSKNGSQSKKIKKDSKASKQRTKASSKTPQKQPRPPPSDLPSSAPEPKKEKRFMQNEMPTIPSSVNQDEPEDTPLGPDSTPEVAAAEAPQPEPAPAAPLPEVTAAGTGEAVGAGAAAPAAAEGENQGEAEGAEGAKKDEEEEKDSGEEKSKKKKKHKKKHKKKKHKKHHKKSDDDEEEESKKKSKRHHKKKKKHRKTPVDHVAPEIPNCDKPGETKFENYPAAAPAPEQAAPDAPESPAPQNSDPNATPASPAAETPPAQPDLQPQPNVVAAGSAAGTAADRMNELIAKNEAAAAAAAGGGQAPPPQPGEEHTTSLFVTGMPDDVRLALEKKYGPGKRPPVEQMTLPAPTDAAPQPTGGTPELIKVPSCGKTGEVVAAQRAMSAEKKGSVTDLEPKPPVKKVPSTELLQPPAGTPTSAASPGGKPNKPRAIPRDIKAERITKLNLKRGKEAYPTMNDVLSDWDSKEEAPPAAPGPEKAAELARLAKEAAKKAESEEAREAKRYNEEQEMKLRKEEEAASERHRKKPKDPAASQAPHTPPPAPVPSTLPESPAVKPGEKKEEITPEKQAEIDRVRKLRSSKPKPMPIKRNSWEEKIAAGKVMRPKNEYPTFGDIVSDWEDVADDKADDKKQKKK